MEKTVTVYNIDDLIFELQKIRHKNPTIALGQSIPNTSTVDFEYGIHISTTIVKSFGKDIHCLLLK